MNFPRLASLSPAALRTALKLSGWKFEGERPAIPRYVALAAPHTSNWDGLLLLSLTASIDLTMRWMIKDEWTKGVIGKPIRALGAVPIDRSRSRNLVDQMIDEFRHNDNFVLFIPPEGTRARADFWKSGFYHIARGANVPVVPGYLDYARKRAGLGDPIELTGNVKADMDRIRAFYAEKKPVAFDPSCFGPIRLREEGDGAKPHVSPA